MARKTIGAIRTRYGARNDPYARGIQMITYSMSDSLGIVVPDGNHQSHPSHPSHQYMILAEVPPLIPINQRRNDPRNDTPAEANTLTTTQYVSRFTGQDLVLLSSLMNIQNFNMVMVGTMEQGDYNTDCWKFALDIAAYDVIQTCGKKKKRAFIPVVKRMKMFTTGILIEWEMSNPATFETMPISNSMTKMLCDEFNKYDGWNTGDTPLLAICPLPKEDY